MILLSLILAQMPNFLEKNSSRDMGFMHHIQQLKCPQSIGTLQEWPDKGTILFEIHINAQPISNKVPFGQNNEEA